MRVVDAQLAVLDGGGQSVTIWGEPDPYHSASVLEQWDEQLSV